MFKGDMQKSENCLGQVDRMLPEEEVVESSEVGGFVSVKQHVMKKIDVGIEADRLDNVAESTIAKGFEEGFEKSDKLSDMTRALENIRKSRNPRIGELGIRR
jgi:hypothetical protein